MVLLEELTAYLNDYLAVRDIPDYREAYNGLQVAAPRKPHRENRRVRGRLPLHH